MIIRCDSCSVSLQLDESKVPGKTFTVRCPRCQNLIRVADGSQGDHSAVSQLKSNSAAPAVKDNAEEFKMKESEFEVNNAMKSLLTALQSNNVVQSANDTEGVKPRRALLCMGKDRKQTADVLVEKGFKVYIAETPAQANERLREGKTEVLLLSPDFASEYGGTAIVQQKVNAMYASERRRLYLVSIEDGATTMNAHEAFLRNLNLIVGTGDIQQLPMILERALQDFNDLYLYYNRATGMDAL